MMKTSGSFSWIGKRLRQLSGFCILCSAAVLPLRAAPAGAEISPQDRFLAIYVEIQDADRAAAQGYFTKAAGQYREAQAALEALHRENPQWEKQIVEYRLGYVGKQLAEMEKRIAGQPPPAVTPSSPVESRLQEVEDKLAKLEASRESNADKTVLNQQMLELRDLLGKVQGELSELKSARSKQLAEEAATQAEVAKIGILSSEVDSLNAQIGKLKKSRKNEGERVRLQKRVEELQGQLAHARTAQEKANERKAVQEKMKELSGQVVALQEELARVKAAQQTAAQAAGGEPQEAGRVVALEGTVQRLESQLAQAQQEQQRLQAESPIAAQSQEVIQLRAQMERIQAEVARMQGRKEIRRLETTTTANSSEVAALKDRVRKLEDELMRTRQRQERLLTSVAGQRNDLQSRVNELEAELDRLQSARTPPPAPNRGGARQEAVPPPPAATPWSASTGHRPAPEEPPSQAGEKVPEEEAVEQPPRTAQAEQRKATETKKSAEAKKRPVRHRREGSAVEEEVVRGLNRVRREIANLIGG